MSENTRQVIVLGLVLAFLVGMAYVDSLETKEKDTIEWAAWCLNSGGFVSKGLDKTTCVKDNAVIGIWEPIK